VAMVAGLLIAAGQFVLGEALAEESGERCPPDNAVSISCGYHFLPIESRVVTRTTGDEFVPVRRVQVFTGFWKDGAFKGELKKVKAKYKKNGDLRFRASVHYSLHEGCKDSEPYRREIYGTRHYLLRSKGCEDLILKVSSDGAGPAVEMKCGSVNGRGHR